VNNFFRECALKIALTRSIFSPNAPNIVWRPGSARTRWGAYSAPPDPIAGLRGPISTGRGRGGDRSGEKGGRKGKGKGEDAGRSEREERKGEGKGKGGWCPHMTCLHDAPGPILGYDYLILFLYVIKAYFVSQTLHVYRKQVCKHTRNKNTSLSLKVVCRRH